jgi:hypothetical protein
MNNVITNYSTIMLSGSIFTTFIILLVEAEEDGMVFKGVTIEKFEGGFHNRNIILRPYRAYYGIVLLNRTLSCSLILSPFRAYLFLMSINGIFLLVQEDFF